MAEHVSSPRMYLAVFAALIVLTVLTWGVALVDLGPLNDVVAMAIAVTKAVLVVLFFMHVRWSTRLTQLTVVGGFLWLGILIVLTIADYLSRGAFGMLGK